MVNRLLVSSLLAVVGCGERHDPPVFDPGGNPDARVFHDARVYEDARVFEDAHEFHDAPPPPPVRMCVNKTETLNQGQETLQVGFECGALTDQGVVFVTIHGGSGSGEEMRTVQQNLNCGALYSVTNNFWLFPATQIMKATHVAGASFDVDCTDE